MTETEHDDLPVPDTDRVTVTDHGPAAGEVDPAAPIDRDLVSWWGHVLEGFYRTHAEVTRPVEREFGLGAAPAEVVLRLGRTPLQRLPMSQIARETALTSGGFTKLADRLIAAGLARRVRCEDDRRVIYLELTDQGVTVAAQVEASTAQALRTQLLGIIGIRDAQVLSSIMLRLRDGGADAAS